MHPIQDCVSITKHQSVLLPHQIPLELNIEIAVRAIMVMVQFLSSGQCTVRCRGGFSLQGV